MMQKQNFLGYKTSFDSLMGAKPSPNKREKALFARAEKYIRKISWVPGIRMIAVVNSLSMYATHENSDIDLFIVTGKGMMWFVRMMVTGIFWISGVWRHGKDIAGHFCLSFFIEEDAMDMGKIVLEDDIYLFFWLYYMKPVLVVGDTWKEFMIQNAPFQFEHNRDIIPIQKDKISPFESIAKICNILIKLIGERKSIRNYEKKGRPEGVIITANMLKFHDQDKRREVRDKILVRDDR